MTTNPNAMVEEVLSKEPPEPIGSHILLELTQEIAMERGLYLAGSGSTDKEHVKNTFIVKEFGEDVDEIVRHRLPVGTKVFIDFTPALHSIVSQMENTDDKKVFGILTLPQYIKGKW